MTIRIPVELVDGGVDTRLRSAAARTGRSAGDAFRDAFERETRNLDNNIVSEVAVNARVSFMSAQVRSAGARAGLLAGEAFQDAFDLQTGNLARNLRARVALSFTNTGFTLGQNLGQGVDRGASSGISSFGQLSFSLSKIASGFTGLIGLTTPLGTGLVGAAAAAVALAAGIGQASGVALSAAGIFASLGLAAVTVKLGLVGMTDAVSAAVTAQNELLLSGKVSAESQEKLDEALKKLPAGARGVVRAIAEIAPSWIKVQRATQNSLLLNLGGPLQKLSGTYLPIVRRELLGTARDLNGTARGFVSMITSAGAVETVTGILQGLRQTLSNILPAVGNIAAGLGILFAGAVPSSASLATSLVGVSEAFRGWATGITDSGRLATFLGQAHTAASDLFGILGNLGSTILSVFGAGAEQGRGFLATLNEQTESLKNLVQSAAGQSALAAFFATTGVAAQVFGDVLSILGPVLTGVTDVLVALQPGLQDLREALLPIAQVISEDLGAALTALAPVLGTTLQVFARLVTAISPLAPVLVPLAAGIFLATKAWAAYRVVTATIAAVQLGLIASTYGTAGANLVAGQSAVVYNAAMAVQRARTIAVAVAQRAATIAAAAFAAIQSGLAAAVNLVSLAAIRQRVAVIAMAVAQRVVAVATKAWAAAQLLLSAALTANPIGLIIVGLVALAAGLVLAYQKSETFRAIVDGAFKAIKAVAMPVINWLVENVPKAFSFVAAAIRLYVKAYWTVVKTAFNIIKTVVTTVLKAVKTVISTQFGIYKTVITTVLSAIRIVITKYFGVYKTVITMAVGAVRTVFNAVFRDMFKKVQDRVVTGVGNVVSTIKSLPGKIKAVASAMYTAGKELVTKVFEGIKAAASSAGSLVSSLASQIRSAINSALNLPLKVDFDKGPIHIHATIIPAFANGVKNFQGGLALVGERGPELVELPKGSNVIPNNETAGRARDIGSGDGLRIENNFFGPTTSGGRLQEMEWTVRYATGARRETVAGVPA